jgi:hypothetical protein
MIQQNHFTKNEMIWNTECGSIDPSGETNKSRIYKALSKPAGIRFRHPERIDDPQGTGDPSGPAGRQKSRIGAACGPHRSWPRGAAA